jgi:hypothetical protein
MQGVPGFSNSVVLFCALLSSDNAVSAEDSPEQRFYLRED